MIEIGHCHLWRYIMKYDFQTNVEQFQFFKINIGIATNMYMKYSTNYRNLSLSEKSTQQHRVFYMNQRPLQFVFHSFVMSLLSEWSWRHSVSLLWADVQRLIQRSMCCIISSNFHLINHICKYLMRTWNVKISDNSLKQNVKGSFAGRSSHNLIKRIFSLTPNHRLQRRPNMDFPHTKTIKYGLYGHLQATWAFCTKTWHFMALDTAV